MRTLVGWGAIAWGCDGLELSPEVLRRTAKRAVGERQRLFLSPSSRVTSVTEPALCRRERIVGLRLFPLAGPRHRRARRASTPRISDTRRASVPASFGAAPEALRKENLVLRCLAALPRAWPQVAMCSAVSTLRVFREPRSPDSRIAPIRQMALAPAPTRVLSRRLLQPVMKVTAACDSSRAGSGTPTKAPCSPRRFGRREGRQ
jgi:hypothetical protein